MTDRQVLSIVARSLLLAIVIGAIAWFAWTVRSVLVLLLVAVVLATGLSPIVDAIAGIRPERKRLRLSRGQGTLVLYLGLIAGLALLFVGVIPPLVEQTEDLARKLPGYLQSARQALGSLAVAYPVLAGLDERLAAQFAESIASVESVSAQAPRVLRFALSVLGGLLSFLLLLVLTLYLIVDGDTIRRRILALLPPENRPLAETALDQARVKIAAWLIGQALLSTIIGAATFVGLVLLGVPYALLLAVVAGIGELIPILGPILSAVPAVVVAFLISPIHGLLTLGLYVLIQQLENHVVVPQVMRRAVDLPPVVVIVALMMGSEALGIVGAIIALPVAAAVSVVVGELVALRDARSQGSREPLDPPTG